MISNLIIDDLEHETRSVLGDADLTTASGIETLLRAYFEVLGVPQGNGTFRHLVFSSPGNGPFSLPFVYFESDEFVAYAHWNPNLETYGVSFGELIMLHNDVDSVFCWLVAWLTFAARRLGLQDPEVPSIRMHTRSENWGVEYLGLTHDTECPQNNIAAWEYVDAEDVPCVAILEWYENEREGFWDELKDFPSPPPLPESLRRRRWTNIH